jgi:hypothetical protein
LLKFKKNRVNPGMRNQNGGRHKRSGEFELPVISPKFAAKLRKREIAAFQKLSEKEQARVWEWSRKIIREYRSTLESNPNNLRDVKDLPAPKDDIKLAIKIALPVYVSKDLQLMIKVLKNAYKELGAFQPLDRMKNPNTSGRPSELKSKNDDRRSDVTSDADTALIVSEKKALIEEINNFVTDLESSVGSTFSL